MSAFIVSDETLACVVSAFERLRSVRDNSPIHSRDELSRLGNQFAKLNADAVEQRYGDPVAVATKFQYNHRAYSKVQQFKCLQCLIYQCSEGDVPKRKLFKMLQDRANSLACEIVNESKEYNVAKWDLED